MKYVFALILFLRLGIYAIGWALGAAPTLQ
jgi:hypothetical protein